MIAMVKLERSPKRKTASSSIGRHSTSAIQVDDPLASRVHAYLLASPREHKFHIYLPATTAFSSMVSACLQRHSARVMSSRSAIPISP